MAEVEDHYAACREALNTCREKSISRLLVDLSGLRSRGFPTPGCLRFGERAAEALPGIKVAHVLPADQNLRRDIAFTITVEANRGMPVGEFDTVEDARTWLLEL
jgi:hypothetical protein